MLSLRKNIAFTMGGSLTYNLSQWGWFIVLAKLVDKEAIGIFSLALAIASPLFLFSGLQLRSLYVTDASNTFHFSEYFTLRTLFSIISLFLLIIFSLLYQNDSNVKYAILFITFAKMFESISDLMQGAFQKRFRMDVVSVSLVIKGISSLLLLTIAIFLTKNVVYATLAVAIAWMLSLFLFDIPRAFKLFNKFNRIKFLPLIKAKISSLNVPRIKSLIWMALPLGGVMGLISLNANIPKYFIASMMGNEMLGAFSAVGYIVMLGRLIDISLGETIAPKLAEYLRDNNKNRFIKLMFTYHLLGLFICIVSSIIAFYFGSLILSILYTKEYADYNMVFFILILGNGVVWTFSFLNHSMIIFRKTREQLYITILSTLTLITLSFILIPSKGLIGAAIAILITNLIPVPIRIIYIYKSFIKHFY